MRKYKRAPGNCGLPEGQFYILKTLLELEPDYPGRITQQSLIDKLYDNKFWTFFTTAKGVVVSQDLVEDINQLYQGGYIFADGNGTILLTGRAVSIYKKVYGKFPKGFS